MLAFDSEYSIRSLGFTLEDVQPLGKNCTKVLIMDITTTSIIIKIVLFYGIIFHRFMYGEQLLKFILGLKRLTINPSTKKLICLS